MEKEIKIKVGDKVLLKNRRGEYWNPEGGMDEYMGKVVTVSYIDNDGEFTIEEDCNWIKWWFRIDDIERIMYDDFKLDDLQFADIVTTRNGERYVVVNGRIYRENTMNYGLVGYYNEDLTYDDDECYDIMRVERAGQVIWERFEEKKEPAKEMTIAEISEALGYEVKVVKE